MLNLNKTLKYLKIATQLLLITIKKSFILPLHNLWIRKVHKDICNGSNNTYFLIVNHMGDTFVTLSILENSRKYRMLQDNVIPIIFEGYKDLMTYFPFLSKKFLTWKNERFFLMNSRNLSDFNGFILNSSRYNLYIGILEKVRYKNLILIGYKYKYFKTFIKHIVNTNNISYARFDNYLKFVLGVPFDIPAKLEFQRNQRTTKKALEFMKEHNLKIGKTVILAPYSNSASSSKSEENLRMFEMIATMLALKGYTVCTNVDRKNSKPIKGTIPISPDLDILIDLAELCGYVVAFRSGFTDIVANSSAKLFVYYPRTFVFPQVSFYHYTSLSDIFDNPNVLEIEGDRDKFIQVINDVL